MTEKKHKIQDLLEGTGLEGTFKYLFTVYNYFLNDGSEIWPALKEKNLMKYLNPILPTPFRLRLPCLSFCTRPAQI